MVLIYHFPIVINSNNYVLLSYFPLPYFDTLINKVKHEQDIKHA